MVATRTVTPEEQFLAYYDRLRNEINKIYTYYEICKTLKESQSRRSDEYKEALTFFSEVMNTTLFATVMGINRFIDYRRDSLNLNFFFNFVKSNLVLFSAEAYRKRLKDSGRDDEDCDHWVGKHTAITREMVEQDKARVESLPVKHLKVWRDKMLAHIERNMVTDNIDIMREYPVTIQEIDNIIVALHEILDRYRIAYDGVQWMLGLPPVKPQIEYIMDSILSYRQSKKAKDYKGTA